MQISSTSTCGRPGSRGAVCLPLRRARLLSSLKARPSCWTPAPRCWKCSSFKVQKLLTLKKWNVFYVLLAFSVLLVFLTCLFLCAQEGRWCLMKRTSSSRQKTSWSQTADDFRSAKRGRRSSTKPSSRFTETCVRPNFPFTEPRRWPSERECWTCMVWTHTHMKIHIKYCSCYSTLTLCFILLLHIHTFLYYYIYLSWMSFHHWITVNFIKHQTTEDETSHDPNSLKTPDCMSSCHVMVNWLSNLIHMSCRDVIISDTSPSAPPVQIIVDNLFLQVFLFLSPGHTWPRLRHQAHPHWPWWRRWRGKLDMKLSLLLPATGTVKTQIQNELTPFL